ncbi:MAG: PadR family transcriptional regulator [Terracidiphilus sp.]|jgi:DNA-binding PadR family transcriptional regulator
MHTHDFDFFEDRNRRFAGRRGPGSPDRPERAPGEREHHGFLHGFGGHGPAGPERGFGFRGHGGFGRGFGEGRGRLFDAGDVKLVILKLLSEQPSYGYQLIKTMEQRMAGGYTPSAGVIYPTLTLIEEEGLAAVSLDNNKKVYSLTPEGVAFLEANKTQIKEIFARLEDAGRGFERGRSPEIIKAFLNLRGAVIARVSRECIKPEQINKIVEAINSAAQVIDEL